MIKEGIEKEGVSKHSCVLILHVRQLLLLQGCCLEGLVQVLAWTLCFSDVLNNFLENLLKNSLFGQKSDHLRKKLRNN